MNVHCIAYENPVAITHSFTFSSATQSHCSRVVIVFFQFQDRHRSLLAALYCFYCNQLRQGKGREVSYVMGRPIAYLPRLMCYGL